jgi:oligopeptide transport system permease protein
VTWFVIRRILWFVPTLLAIYTISFVVLRAAPGSPFVGEKALDPAVVKELEHQHYLDRPWYVGYAYTLEDLVTLRGQMSMRYQDRNVIHDILAPALPISLGLGLLALSLAVVAGVGAGVYSAVRRYRAGDYLATGAALVGISLPSFVVASLLMMVFSFWLRWLPAGGWGTWSQVVLPAVTLAAFPAAYIARLTRSSMIETLPAEFIRSAYAKGLPGSQVVLVHALKNAFLPVLGYLGPAAAGVFTGSFVVERIFAIPGVGNHFVQSALNRDHPLILATVMLYSTLLVALNLAVDIGYAVLDPRIRYE